VCKINLLALPFRSVNTATGFLDLAKDLLGCRVEPSIPRGWIVRGRSGSSVLATFWQELSGNAGRLLELPVIINGRPGLGELVEVTANTEGATGTLERVRQTAFN